MSTKPLLIPPAETRQRLLEAAGETFADHGFHQATVRDICAKAGANVAAVNYHFGDKLKLYVAVLEHWFAVAMRRYPPDGGLPAGAGAEERLHAFVRSFLFRLMDQGIPTWHGKLMAREMADPVPGAFDALIENHVRPHSKLLGGILGELLGPGVSQEQVRACIFSVVGQILFYRHCENTIRQLDPEMKFDPESIDRIARHITQFSLSGVRSIAAAAPTKSDAAARQKGKGRS